MIEFIFLVLFFAVSIVEVFGEFKDNDKIIFITKPLLMPLLILFYVFGAPINKIDWLIVVALIGAFAGDTFLMLRNQDKWFIYGMGAFLINQIFYAISFFLSITDVMAFNLWGLFLLGPAIFILLFIVPKFINKTEKFKIPVIVYMTALLIMHIVAVLRLAEFQGLPFILVYLGSICYIFSDSFLALNKWESEAREKRMIIAVTYFMAQLYITLGVLLTSLL